MRKLLLFTILGTFALSTGTGCRLFRDNCHSCDKPSLMSGHGMPR